MTSDDTTGTNDKPDDVQGLSELLDAEERPPARNRKRRGWVYTLLIGLLCLPLIAVGFYAFVATSALNNIKRDPSALPAESGRPTVSSYNYQNIVLMGSDSRDAANASSGRSDVLMIAHINASRNKVYLISFPRDMLVPIPGHGQNKINAAYAFGGPALSVQTLEGMLNLRMNHTALVDFDGFINLTNTVGGVTVYNAHAGAGACIDASRKYTYPVGEITISGEAALCYVRERYELPNGDLDRAERQRAVVKALIVKLFKPEVIANPVTFSDVASQLSQFITVDSTFTSDALRDLALSMRITGSNDIVMLQAPISGFANDPVHGSVDVVNTTQLAELASAMATDSMTAYCDKYHIG
jgi:polyisoprenyl-teichoic acid--peptidoglycan teichoic acid transferase